MKQKHSLRNLGLDLVRATEASALVAGRWMGRGVFHDVKTSASRAMAKELNSLKVGGTIICGADDRSPDKFLPKGEHVGRNKRVEVEYAVDPIDGSRLLASGGRGAISAIAVTESGGMYSPYPAKYMEKLVVDRHTAPALVPECLDAPVAWTLALIARRRKVDVSRLVVFVLDRPRHQDLIEEIRTAGARVMLRSDGDIAGALHVIFDDDIVDCMMGVGGVTEGVMAAAAVKAQGGAMLARLAPQSEVERQRILSAELDPDQILTQDDLIRTNRFFFVATGVTDGSILRGMRYRAGRATTESLILRGKTQTKRLVQAEHILN